MLTIQPIMNSIDATTNGKQSDDFQSANFNADDDFGDFADFQGNKLGDDDFGDFTFFQSSTNVNNSSNFNSCSSSDITTASVLNSITTTTMATMMTTVNNFSVNGFRIDDNIETKQDSTVQLRSNETSNDDFGDFTSFQCDNCDKAMKSNENDDDFGDFTFSESNDNSKVGTTIKNYQVAYKDANTDGNLNFFSTPTMTDDRKDFEYKTSKLDQLDVKNNYSVLNLDQSVENHDGGDDFGDFQETVPVSNSDDTETIRMMTNSNSSINHQSIPLLACQTVLPADRQQLSTSTTTQKSDSTPGNRNDSLTSNSPLASIVCQSFAKDIQNGDSKIISNDLFANTASQSYKMWQSLINWEEAASLKLNWEASHTFQVLLRSLKIDSRNIQMPSLRDISTPLIPSKLTILQPTPLLPSIVPLEPQVSQSHRQQPPTLSPVSLNNSLDNNKKHHLEQSASSIPEASFDWNSSGLTNPLEKDWLILL